MGFVPIKTHPSALNDCPMLKYLFKISSPQHSFQKHRHQGPSTIWSACITGCCPNPISFSEKNFWPF